MFYFLQKLLSNSGFEMNFDILSMIYKIVNRAFIEKYNIEYKANFHTWYCHDIIRYKKTGYALNYRFYFPGKSNYFVYNFIKKDLIEVNGRY